MNNIFLVRFKHNQISSDSLAEKMEKIKKFPEYKQLGEYLWVIKTPLYMYDVIGVFIRLQKGRD